MKQTKKKTFLILMSVTLLGVLVFSTGAPRNSSALALRRAQATATDSGSDEVPPDAKSLALDTPLTEALTPDTAIRFYTFTAKAGTNYRLIVEPKSGDFYTTVTVMTFDLETIIAGTVGESVISGSLIFRAPADGKYAITVEYASAQDGTPPSGSYQVELSEFKLQ